MPPRGLGASSMSIASERLRRTKGMRFNHLKIKFQILLVIYNEMIRIIIRFSFRQEGVMGVWK